MIDREKVIKGLECCLPPHGPDCVLCPYDSIDLRCRAKLRDDIMMLLKAQEPRLMTPADVNNIGSEDKFAFVEIREETHMYACYMRKYDETHTEIMCEVPDLPTKLQNGCARIWTARPTDEQRKAVKWNESN